MSTDDLQLKQIEIDTLRMVARGLSNRAIAEAQGAPVDTVKSRIARLHKLLGTSVQDGDDRNTLSRIHLVIWAYEYGLVEGKPSVTPEFRDACIEVFRAIVNEKPRGDLKQFAREGLRALGVDQPNRHRYKPAPRA